MFEKVLVANRGEIAIRVMRTLQEMGIASVGVYSEADRDDARTSATPTRRTCSARRRPPRATSTIEKIIEVAKSAGAEAVHPGYGFLAENADVRQRAARRRASSSSARPRARSRRWARRRGRAS